MCRRMLSRVRPSTMVAVWVGVGVGAVISVGVRAMPNVDIVMHAIATGQCLG